MWEEAACLLLQWKEENLERKVICKVWNRWINERVEQTRAMRGLSTGKQAAAVQRGRSAPSEEEKILLRDMCVWPDNPCNKLLPHVSQIRIVVSVYSWSQSQVNRVLIWCVVIPNISFQLKTKWCTGSQWRVWNREVNCLRLHTWFVADLKSSVLPWIMR